MTYCQYCSEEGAACSKRLAGYGCTCNPGHSGSCVACGILASEHDLAGTAPFAPVISNSRIYRRCVCVRSVRSGGTFPYYSPAVLVERVTKDGRRIWRVLDSRPIDQDFRSIAKATRAAEEIAASLGIQVILGARHNRPVSNDSR